VLDVANDSALPVTFPLQVGDTVLVHKDVLAELARHAPGLPPTWLMLPSGTEGKLLGYRERGVESYAIVEIAGIVPRLVVFVREDKLRLRGPQWPARAGAQRQASSAEPRSRLHAHVPRLRRRSSR